MSLRGERHRQNEELFQPELGHRPRAQAQNSTRRKAACNTKNKCGDRVLLINEN